MASIRLPAKAMVLIPGKGDPAYDANTSIFRRGVEGNWYYAWDEWEKVARPLIENATKPR